MKRTAVDGRVFFDQRHEPGWHTFGSVVFVQLHPDTDPAAIAAGHRREVADAVRVAGLVTPAEIAEPLYLPESIVRRHLDALGLLAPARGEERVGRGQAAARVRAVMARADRPLTGKEVAERAGVAYVTAHVALTGRPDLYERQRLGPPGAMRPRFVWALKAKARAGRPLA